MRRRQTRIGVPRAAILRQAAQILQQQADILAEAADLLENTERFASAWEGRFAKVDPAEHVAFLGRRRDPESRLPAPSGAGALGRPAA